jgi:hypothetical protein
VNISTDSDNPMTPLMKNVQLQRASGVKVPHLIRANSVKRRKVTGLKEVVDTRRHVARPIESITKSTDGDDI